MTRNDIHNATRAVLIIDDDPFVREVIDMSFASAGGWTIQLADSGAAGVRAAQDSPPDIILLDLTMPDMDGITTLAALQQDSRTQGVPVVFVTADDGSARRLRTGVPGVAGVILKPFDPMTLPEQVANLMDAGAVAARPKPAPSQLDDALMQLWLRQRPQVLEELDELAILARTVDTDPSPEALESVRRIVHTLIGLLGTLGLYRSCELARHVDREVRSMVAGRRSDEPRVELLTTRLQAELADELPELTSISGPPAGER